MLNLVWLMLDVFGYCIIMLAIVFIADVAAECKEGSMEEPVVWVWIAHQSKGNGGTVQVLGVNEYTNRHIHTGWFLLS